MRSNLLILCSTIWSITTGSVVAQSTGSSIDPVGIHWNGFSDKRKFADQRHVTPEPVVGNTSIGHDLPAIPSPWSYHALGLFCKAEVKLNSVLPFPLMMRLGDVRRAEELDGKGDPLTRP